MNIINIQQGSKEWLDLRLTSFTASEAPIVMAASKFMKRDELLRLKKSGVADEPSDAQKHIFAKGHQAEAMARPIIEQQTGEELYPVTGRDGVYLASLDGIDLMESFVWEHKLWNESLVVAVKNEDLPAHYYWQLEHQLMVSGAEYALFTVSDGTEENMISMKYYPVAGRKEQLIAGWDQFAKDLEEYEIKEVKQEAVAGHVESLPVISYELNGLALKSNFEQFKSQALMALDQANRPLVTDQDFADRDALNKVFKKAEKLIKDTSEKVINEVSEIATFRDDLAAIGEQIRKARLAGEKAVKAEKENRKYALINDANTKAREFVGQLDHGALIDGLPDFSLSIKGMKSLASMESAINDEMAKFKIFVNERHTALAENAAILDAQKDHYFLFSDREQLLKLAAGQLSLVVESRISDHKAQEKEKIEKAKKVEADRIEREQQLKQMREQQVQQQSQQQSQGQALTATENQLQVEVQQAPTAKPQQEIQQEALNHTQTRKTRTPPTREQLILLVQNEYALTFGQSEQVLINAFSQ